MNYKNFILTNYVKEVMDKESEDISDLGRLITKYQKKFNKAIKNRNEASHEAVKTGDRTLWNRFNIEAFILIDVLEDLRSLR